MTTGLRADARFALGTLPTPLVAATRLGAHLGVQLTIKRDDLIGFAQAGTKTRALEVLVADARIQGCDCLVGCGGPDSNFLPALVAAGRVAGMDSHLVCVGDPPRQALLPPNLAMATRWGATIAFTGDPDRDRVEAAAHAHAVALASSGRRPYVLPRGGATPVGAMGAARAVAELADPAPTRIVVAAGSGATAAGLLAGIAARGWPTTVVAAVVSRSVPATGAAITDLAGRCAARMGLRPQAEDGLELVDAIGPGFHVAGPADRAAADLALATEGLLLDSTYTAKAMAAIIELARGAALGGSTVFWHTGGVVGALGAFGAFGPGMDRMPGGAPMEQDAR